MTDILLDVHAHLIPATEAELSAFDGVTWDETSSKFEVDGHVVGIKSIFRAANLLAWMDENRVQVAWVSAPPPVYRPQLDEAAATDWCAALNRGLSSIAAAHPTRLAPLFHLPVQHPALAARIAAEQLAQGNKRFSMPAGDVETQLSSAAFEPLWQLLHDHQAFLFLHPGEGCDPRLDPFYLHNLLGNPSETAIAASHLVFAGIVERFSGIDFCLAHAGGTTAAVADRWQQGWSTKRPGLDVTREAPRKMLRRICVDCISHGDRALHLASDVFGENHVMFGSDWPFPMGLLRPHEQLAYLSPAQRQAIFCDNPKRLLEGD